MLIPTIALVLFGVAGVMYALNKQYPSSLVSFGLTALTWALLF